MYITFKVIQNKLFKINYNTVYLNYISTLRSNLTQRFSGKLVRGGLASLRESIVQSGFAKQQIKRFIEKNPPQKTKPFNLNRFGSAVTA